MPVLAVLLLALGAAVLIYLGCFLAVNHMRDEYEHMQAMRQAVEDDMQAMHQATGLMDAFIAARAQIRREE